MPWAILSVILQTLASSGLSGDTVSKYLAFMSALFGRGGPTEDALKALKEHVERMVAEKRPPTESEWAELRARSDAAHDRIQAG